MRGQLSDTEYRRVLNLFSRAGLSMDHAQFDEEILEKGTKAILKTRDGKLRAAIPSPLGSCVFLNDVSYEELVKALHLHKQVMKEYPRQGEGIEAFVDASDTGYTINGAANGASSLKKAADPADGVPNGGGPVQNGYTSKASTAVRNAAGCDGILNGVNGHANGSNGASH